MNSEEFRVIPGYEGYSVSQSGVIKSIQRDLVLQQYLLNGYFIVDAFRGALTETLPVHRAVALAWVSNPDPLAYSIVNHKDGQPLNNWYKNLEWTNHSGNNYHAVNTGLRSDNIPCRVRDYDTGKVSEFSSIAQAAEFMGLRKDTSLAQLRPKKFGALITDRYEFRFGGESEPWFFEHRQLTRGLPSRYQVKVYEANGDVREIYSVRILLKDYQLYRCPEGKSVPALAAYGNRIYPDKRFVVRDSFEEAQYRENRQTLPSKVMGVQAQGPSSVMNFKSLSECAKYFDVDRSSITGRLLNGKDLDGWTFIQQPA